MPKVAVAVPVYNGERYLEASIASLLAQTFGDFELLILDNASTDGSEKISRAFAARDPRVRYHRNPQNIGGGPNWNLAFELAGPAPYFKWAAHDDIHAPRFLERCVAALDADPGAVLAFTGANRIDPDGNPLGPRTLELPLGSPDWMARFFPLLESYDCLEIHAVMRRDALLKLGKPVLGMHLDGDGVMLIRLALMGHFHLVDECLFSYRSHEGQTVNRFDKDYEAWVRWWDSVPGRTPRVSALAPSARALAGRPGHALSPGGARSVRRRAGQVDQVESQPLHQRSQEERAGDLGVAAGPPQVRPERLN